MAFTIFYDGKCPLCMKEMRQLAKRNTDNQLIFEDITADDFAQRFPLLDPVALDAKIHGMEADGTIITGLDVTHRAWGAVGKGWLYAPLRWPVIRIFADKFYLWFANNRHQLSYILTREKRCESDCGIKY